MKVVAISGKAQSGKDTTARFVKEALESRGSRVLITHYADLLKYICKNFFGWNGVKDDAGRHILQYVGTDVVRKHRPNFWVGFLIDILDLFPDEWDCVLIPDCRFPNEIDELKKAGRDVIHIRVEREGFKSPLTPEHQTHISETALDNTMPDIVVENVGALKELGDTADKIAGIIENSPTVFLYITFHRRNSIFKIEVL